MFGLVSVLTHIPHGITLKNVHPTVLAWQWIDQLLGEGPYSELRVQNILDDAVLK